MNRSGRIRVFLSSTILDFADLRSALKFWLEELGFEVVLSEYNDFTRRPDSGTFDACFEAIRTCDYYILLVGCRAGSEFSPGVAVTRAEYRVALELLQAGLIHVIPFLRNDVRLALRLDDESAAKALGLAYDEKTQYQLKGVKELYDEVKNTEIPAAPDGSSGNLWIYGFHGFEDIAAALRVTMKAHRSVRRHVLLANLKHEIEINLQRLFTKDKKGIPQANHRHLAEWRHQFPVPDGRPDEVTTIPGDFASDISLSFIISMGAARGLQGVNLDACIGSGEFLQFDPHTQSLAESAELRGMRVLARELDLVRSIAEMFQGPMFNERIGKIFADAQASTRTSSAPAMLIIALFAYFDRLENILRLSESLYGWICQPGNEYKLPELFPSSPIEEQARGLIEETITEDEIRYWLTNPNVRDLLIYGRIPDDLRQED